MPYLQRITSAPPGHTTFQEIVAVGSEWLTKSKELGFGDKELRPWQVDAVK